jgi:hypothetical protein
MVRKNPESSISLSNKLEAETKEAKEEFSQIADNENKRAQQVAELENERILQRKRTNETIYICPVCLEEINAIKSHEERKRGTREMTMLCCNVRHCINCTSKSIEFIFNGNENCFNCREPAYSMSYWASTIKPDDQRHWLLQGIGRDYLKGTNGIEKNTKKGLKFLERAAELGDAEAQNNLAMEFSSGKSVPECLEKARYYAEKGADQGSSAAQSTLAEMIMHSPDYNSVEGNEKVFKLLTLAYIKALILLGSTLEDTMLTGGTSGTKEKRTGKRIRF